MTGDELRALRKAMNLRQAGLAEGLGLSAPFIGMMERGEKPIEPRTAMSVRYLFEHPEVRPPVAFEDIKVRSAADLIQCAIDHTGVSDGQMWGDWRLHKASLSLIHNPAWVVVGYNKAGEDIHDWDGDYDIDLSSIVEAADALDWIGQIAAKGWGVADLGYLVQALDDILNFQGHLRRECSFENAADVRQHLMVTIKDARRGGAVRLSP